MRIRAYAARSMVYRTARLGDAGENIINEGIAAKVFATEAVGDIVDTGIQLVGGGALRSGHPLEALYRRVRAFASGGGRERRAPAEPGAGDDWISPRGGFEPAALTPGRDKPVPYGAPRQHRRGDPCGRPNSRRGKPVLYGVRHRRN